MVDHRVDGTTSEMSGVRALDTDPEFPFERIRGPASWLAVLFLAVTVIFWRLDITARWEPPYLNVILQITLVSIISLVVAALAIRSFLRSGNWPVLWLAAASLAYGLTIAFSNSLLQWANVNAAVTTHNLNVLLVAFLHLLGAFFVFSAIGRQESYAGRLSSVLTVCLGTVLFVVLVTLGAVLGLLPPFFIQGQGGTPWRQMVVVAAALLFCLDGLAFLDQYRRSRAGFLYWYALGLLLNSLVMAGTLLNAAIGSPLSWLGRGAQMLGGLYLLVATQITLRQARATQVAPEDVLASFFWRDEANLRLLFESMMDAIIVTDQHFVITDWNRAAETVYGWRAEEVVGKLARSVLPTTFVADGDQARWEEAVRNGGAWRGEVRQRRRDGSEFPVLATVSHVRDVAGSVVGTVAVNRDVTGQKRVEAERERLLAQVQQTNTELEAILSAIPAGLIAYDANGKTTRMNALARQWLGWGEETWLRPVSERLVTNVQFLDQNSDRLEPDAFPAMRALRGETVSGVELLVHLPERPALDFWAMFGARPILGSNGELMGAVATGVNTTRLHEANEQLSNANAQLSAQAEELRVAAETLDQRVQERTGELAQANAELARSREQMQELSHRLIEAAENERRVVGRELHDQAGQLLTSLTLGMGILEKRYGGSEEACRHIAYLKEIANDLSKSIHDLAVSLRPASLDRVGLAAALNQLIEVFRSHTDTSIELITTGLHDRLDPDVETAVFRVVQESLNNVVRHAQATRAGVVVQRQNGRVVAIIEDDGKGFSLDSALSGGRLGLTGMRERAEMLGGTLTIETSAGHGTTVFAELPCER